MGTIKAILRILSHAKSWFSGRVLRDGEPAYETDEKGFKIGDGSTDYEHLPYLLPSRENSDGKYLRCVDGDVEWDDVSEQKQTDWEETDSTDDAYLKNMPDVFRNLPDIPSGDAIPDGTVIENIVQDYDGNWYNGVVLNNHIYLKENLKVTHDPEGNDIQYYYPNGSSIWKDSHGLLYSCTTALCGASPIPYGQTTHGNIQGIAPNGWHIPSQDEFFFDIWLSVINTVYNGEYSSIINKHIAYTDWWHTTDIQNTPSNDQRTNNTLHLSIIPAGYAKPSNGKMVYEDIMRAANLITSTGSNVVNYDLYSIQIYYTEIYPDFRPCKLEDCFTVRCICDISASDWFAANRSRLYLKATSTGMVWSQISSVAESGSYNDLTDKPTIPTVNNATLTIQKNGTNIDTFNANSSVDKTINITVPTTASEVGAIPSSEKGTANGVAELDKRGKILSSQLPSYVDDVINGYLYNGTFYEDLAHTNPINPEDGKIYIELVTNRTYRWGGSAYVEISASLALGETSSTAYRGDRGKTAYDHSQVIDGSNPHDTTFANIADKPTTISGYGITDAFSGSYNDLTNKPTIPAAGIPSGGNAGQVLKKTSATDYDVNWANASETLPSAYCTTSGSTAAKKANCSLYVTQTNQYLQVIIGSANTYQGALTLNINSAGAKPIYINGTVSSSSNYKLLNGTYFVFYDGTNYYFRTDGKLPMKDTAFGGSYNDLADKPTIPDVTTKADKVSSATSGNLASLDSNGNLTDSTIAGSSVSDAVSKKHSHSNKSILDLIPSSLGTEGQVIVVNSTEDGLEFGTVASSATQVIFRVWS